MNDGIAMPPVIGHNGAGHDCVVRIQPPPRGQQNETVRLRCRSAAWGCEGSGRRVEDLPMRRIGRITLGGLDGYPGDLV